MSKDDGRAVPEGRGVAAPHFRLWIVALAGTLPLVAAVSAAESLWDWPAEAQIPAAAPQDTGFWAAPDSIENDLVDWTGACDPECVEGCRFIAPIHAALFLEGPAGQIVLFNNAVMKFYDLDPNASALEDSYSVRGTHDASDPTHEPFCCGFSFRKDGSLLLMGGRRRFEARSWCDDRYVPVYRGWTSSLDMSQSSWANRWSEEEDTDLAGPGAGLIDPETGTRNWSRYYPSSVTLPDGDVLVVSGDFWSDTDGDSLVGGSDAFILQPSWVEFDAETDSWSLFPGSTLVPGAGTMPLYPRMAVLPSGLFWDGPYWAQPGQNDYKSRLWAWSSSDDPVGTGVIETQRNESSRNTAGHAIVSLAPWDPREIVVLAGGDRSENEPWVYVAHDDAEWIDYGEATPVWRRTDPFDSGARRRRADLLLLPDGSLFSIGGEDTANAGPNAPVLACDLLDPTTLQATAPPVGAWAQMSSLNSPRMYHSVSLLLPDGRVIAAGNQGEGDSDPGKTYEVYYPAYLFDGNGDYADRPSIDAHPIDLEYGQPFLVEVSPDASDIAEVCLIRPTAITHADNQSQRRVLMDIMDAGGDSLVVTAPPNGRYAPPGKYMMFAIDTDGVPSTAAFVDLQRGDSIVQSGEAARWRGTVRLEEDFVVAKGGSLLVDPGTVILANAEASDPVHVVVRGLLTAVGTAQEPIVFSSWNGPGAAGEWGGLVFDLEGCNRSSYGYVACKQPISELDQVTIENASSGISIEGFCAPKLANVGFSDITDDLHIYLNGSDTFLPAGYFSGGVCDSAFVPWPGTWNLTEGTNVVATNSVINDATWGVGVTGQTDLVADAKLTAEGAAQNPVKFRPATPAPGTGDGWGGLTLNPTSAGSLIEYADIGEAAIPVFAFYPDSGTTLRHTTVHNFANTGIWVYGTGALGAVLDSCVIERGLGLDDELGEVGVRLDEADEFEMSGCTVDLGGLILGQGSSSAAVDVFFGKQFCQTTGAGLDSLVVTDCAVVGPGFDTSAAHQGVRAFWLCGSTDRKILFEGNKISQFSTAGFEFNQCSDVQVTSNCVFDNTRAVDLYRDNEPTGPPVRFRTNWLEVNVGQEEMFRTDDLVKTRLGPAGATLGDNALAVQNDNILWVLEEDPDSLDASDARNNYWYLYASDDWQLQDAVHSGGEPWISRIAPSSAAVDFTPFRTDDSSPPFPTDCSPYPGSAAGSGRKSGLVEGDRPSSAPGEVRAEGLPEATSIELLRSARRGGNVALRLDVAAGDAGRYTVAIYDLQGRRVKMLYSDALGPGRYGMRWDGRADGGEQAASGVYFLRGSGPSFAKVHKIVLVR